MTTQTYTHRLYIDEYNNSFVLQLANNKIEGIKNTSEKAFNFSEKVLALEGTLENLEKVASLMYADEKKIKSVFPSFKTAEDKEMSIREVTIRTYVTLEADLLRLFDEYKGTGLGVSDDSRVDALYNMFTQLNEMKRAR